MDEVKKVLNDYLNEGEIFTDIKLRCPNLSNEQIKEIMIEGLLEQLN